MSVASGQARAHSVRGDSAAISISKVDVTYGVGGAEPVKAKKVRIWDEEDA